MNSERERTRPTLTELFLIALEGTVNEDRARYTPTTRDLFLENATFYDRIISNFIIIASAYYSKDETRKWIEDEFVEGKFSFPSINELDSKENSL